MKQHSGRIEIYTSTDSMCSSSGIQSLAKKQAARLEINKLQDDSGSSVGTYIDLGDEPGSIWLEISTMSIPGSYMQNGVISINESDNLENKLWESEIISDVKDIVMIQVNTSVDQPIILVEWVSGFHSTRSYPIQWVEDGFSAPLIFNQEGNTEDGIGSDGGGTTLFSDGSIVAFRRTYDEGDVRLGVVYVPEQGAYQEQREFVSDREAIDIEAPSTTVRTIPSVNEYGWLMSPTTVFVEAEDNSDVFILNLQLVGPTMNQAFISTSNPYQVRLTEGAWGIGYQALDVNGNLEQIDLFHILVDGTPPVSVHSFVGEELNADVYLGPVEVTLQAKDPDIEGGHSGSGVAMVEYSLDDELTWEEYSTPFLIEAEGKTTLYYRAHDYAGNIEQTRKVDLIIDASPPAVEIEVEPQVLWPPNNKEVEVVVHLEAVSAGSGIIRIQTTVEDESGLWEPHIGSIDMPGALEVEWDTEIPLVAGRNGDDVDGRIYTVRVEVINSAGKSSTAQAQILVPHDQSGDKNEH